MISGYLIAITQFTKSIIGERLKVIATDNYKFVFKSDGIFTFVFFTDISDKNINLQNLLNNIKELFHQQFPAAIAEQRRGNLTHFTRFTESVTSIFNLVQ